MATSLLDFFSKVPASGASDAEAAEAVLRQIMNPNPPPSEAPTTAPCNGFIYHDKTEAVQPALVCEFSTVQKPAITFRFYTKDSLDTVLAELRQHVAVHTAFLHPPEPDEIPLPSIVEAITEAKMFQPQPTDQLRPASFCNVEVPYFIGGNRSIEAIKSLSHLVSDAMGMAIAGVPVELELSLGKFVHNHFDSTISALVFDMARNFVSSEASQAGYSVMPSYTIIDRVCNRACVSCLQSESTCQCQGTEKKMMRHRTTNRSGEFSTSLIFKAPVSKIDLLPALQSCLSDVILNADTLCISEGRVVGTLNPTLSYSRKYIHDLLSRVSGSRVYIDKHTVTFTNLTSNYALNVLAQTLRTTRCDSTKCACKSMSGCECPSVVRANLKTETPIQVDDESVVGFDPDMCTFSYALETRKDEWTIRLRSKVTKRGQGCVTLAERQFAECSKDSDREFDIEVEMDADALQKYRKR